MTHYQPISPLRPYFHHVLMPTVDSAPQQEEWLDAFLSADAIFTYSDWGADVLKNQTNNKIKYRATTAPGVNLDTFFIKDKKETRIKLGIDPDIFIIGSVMRNQKRKLIPELLSTLKNTINYFKQSNIQQSAYLYLHTTYPDMGWDIPELLSQYSVSNNVLFSYLCKNCGNVDASTFCGPQKYCKKCLNKSSSFPAVAAGVSEEQLSDVYNCFDLYVQYAICEGFGMPQVEAGACGIPIATVNYSAMVDIINKLGAFSIPVKSYFKELETKAIRAYPDNDALQSIIIQQLNKEKDIANQERIEIREKTKQYYNWEYIISIWQEYFDNLTFRADWSKPLEILSKPTTINSDLDNFSSCLYLCKEHLKDVSYLSSHRFLNLLQQADYGFSSNGPTQISATSIKNTYDHVAVMIDNINKSEKVRSNNQIKNEDFIQYAHIKSST
jgi:glycosyltransferase involved in cell wall biosynthesis